MSKSIFGEILTDIEVVEIVCKDLALIQRRAHRLGWTDVEQQARVAREKLTVGKVLLATMADRVVRRQDERRRMRERGWQEDESASKAIRDYRGHRQFT